VELAANQAPRAVTIRGRWRTQIGLCRAALEQLIKSLRMPCVRSPCYLLAFFASLVLMTQNQAPERDVFVMFEMAASQGRIGLARKSKIVDARPARAGEIVITVIAGEGEETRSRPAETGDWIVRNRCHETGNEQYLVKAAKFPERYDGPLSEATTDGWRAFRPRGRKMRYFTVSSEEGTFHFTAPWGEPMMARPGDAMIQDLENPSDTYRVAAASFQCTYEVLEAPK
jgi:hypothetical protein